MATNTKHEQAPRWRPPGAGPREQSEYERELRETIKRAESGDILAAEQLMGQFVDAVHVSVKAAETYPGIHVRLLAYFARAFDTIRRNDTPADAALHIKDPAHRPPLPDADQWAEDMRIAENYHRNKPEEIGKQVARDVTSHALKIGDTRIKQAIKRTGNISIMAAVRRKKK